MTHIFLSSFRFIVMITMLGLITLFIGFENASDLLIERWPVFFIAIIAATVANATAVGGGFIFMPLFSFGYGFSPLDSLKLALATQAFGMTSGALTWSIKRIRLKVLAFSLIFSVSGMIIGSLWLSPPTSVINLLFGIVSIILAIALAIELLYIPKPNAVSTIDINHVSIQEWTCFAGLCFMGGLINAWVSIGIGEVVALWMLLKWRYPIAICISTGVAALAICSIAGLIIHSSLGGIRWDFLIFTAPGVIIGGRFGAYLGVLLSNGQTVKTPNSHHSVSAAEHVHQTKHANGYNLKQLIIAVIFIDGIAVLMKAW